jgi:hypothetical protein
MSTFSTTMAVRAKWVHWGELKAESEHECERAAENVGHRLCGQATETNVSACTGEDGDTTSGYEPPV